MRILYRGAESIITATVYDGQDAVIKARIRKGYRIKKLDEFLRKTRTRKEVKMLIEAGKMGIPVPRILHIDEPNHRIIMEDIKGERLKEHLISSSAADIADVCRRVGEIIGRMHANGMVHGDLTTSNIMLKDGELYLIDFSLGGFTRRMEDRGVDLKLLKEAVLSTHFSGFPAIWKGILGGYRVTYEDSDSVISQMQKIEKRARYTTKE